MMSWQCFGKILISSRDLDPIYIMLTDAKLQRPVMKRWLLAYWCYYSAGVASHMAESVNFWDAMWQGYHDGYPRGAERRHWRGQAAHDSLKSLQGFGSPESIVDWVSQPTDFQSIAKRAQMFVGFGPWTAWKIADMVERVLHNPVDFSNSELGIYHEPVASAALIRFGDFHHHITLDELHEVVDEIVYELKDYAAPPYYDRPINVQEAETVLCKYKSYCNGFYPPGKDTKEIYHGMHGWGDLADSLIQHLPKTPRRWNCH